MSSSCYLIDFEGNLWTFGKNWLGLNSDYQLGKLPTGIPTKINRLKDIQQISQGPNNHGQLGTGDKESVSIAKEMNSQYSTIWKDEVYTRSKSARK